MSSGVQRKLTTILAADAEGYSREMEADEVRTLGALRDARTIFAKVIERHHGRIFNTAGDGLIADFPSVVEAVQCAVEVQRELDYGDGGGGKPGEGALRFRIGVHLGDVIVDGEDLLGEGVNLAARLQAMAEPGGVLISQQVYDHVHAKLSVAFDYLGEKRPKNYAADIPVYRVGLDEKPRRNAEAPRGRPAARAPAPAASVPADLRSRVTHLGKILGVLWAALLVLNITTGGGFWAHWPGIAMAAFLGWKAAPLFVRGWFKLAYARGVVIVGALALINIATWTGQPWVFWPAGALIVWYLLYRLRPGVG